MEMSNSFSGWLLHGEDKMNREFKVWSQEWSLEDVLSILFGEEAK